MGAASSTPGAAEAETVRQACRRTLATPGARIYVATVYEQPGGWTEPLSWEIGVADPAARRVLLRHFVSPEDPLMKLAREAEQSRSSLQRREG